MLLMICPSCWEDMDSAWCRCSPHEIAEALGDIPGPTYWLDLRKFAPEEGSRHGA